MIYTYYYGVLCHSCERFASISDYQTNKELALTDVRWDGQMRVDCKHPDCRKSDGYLASELVYSSEEHRMQTLCRQ